MSAMKPHQSHPPMSRGSSLRCMGSLLLPAVYEHFTFDEDSANIAPGDKNGPPLWRQAVIASAVTAAQATGIHTRPHCSPPARLSQIPRADRVASSRWFQLRALKLSTGLTRKRTGKCAAPGHLRAPSSGVSWNISDQLFLTGGFQSLTREKRCPGVFTTEKARLI